MLRCTGNGKHYFSSSMVGEKREYTEIFPASCLNSSRGFDPEANFLLPTLTDSNRPVMLTGLFCQHKSGEQEVLHAVFSFYRLKSVTVVWGRNPIKICRESLVAYIMSAGKESLLPAQQCIKYFGKPILFSRKDRIFLFPFCILKKYSHILSVLCYNNRRAVIILILWRTCGRRPIPVFVPCIHVRITEDRL